MIKPNAGEDVEKKSSNIAGGVLNDTASLQNCLAVPFKTANESVIPRAGNSTLGRLS